ncbi:uncharacterized protein At4g15970-like [Dioscorea cayenensis subsp. rotundata]|uniref:Uncharacterized protein At4g15970-like n=1 Tax=Dioscorea cayennensis subsp. rotundata TaxID=55577 RepID=A0AB40CKW9_DIOCR|nr:uncharacterized protein At4g15970-like [Dioscorea cayenensis subsp. rotundata]
MVDNTVIVTTVNGAWPETEAMLKLFAESLRIGDGTEHLLRHLLVVAMDLRALAMCKSLHVFDHCLYLESVLIRNRDLRKNRIMMLEKIHLLSSVLDLGYSFIFTDLDVLWLRNPLRQFSPSAHLSISSDYYNGNPWDMNNLANTGFFYAKSNAFTIEFYKYWYMSRALYPGLSDNTLFNKIKMSAYVQELGIQINHLDTDYFGGFCQQSEDVRKVITVHANCCAGLEDKLHDLRVVVEDWRKYKNGSVEIGGFKWRVPLNCHL